MSVVDLQELEEVKGLLLKGQQVGVLTFAEVSTAVAEMDLDETDLEELHAFLERSEIELVEEIDPASTAANEVELGNCRGDLGEREHADRLPLQEQALHLFEFLQIDY